MRENRAAERERGREKDRQPSRQSGGETLCYEDYLNLISIKTSQRGGQFYQSIGMQKTVIEHSKNLCSSSNLKIVFV